MKTENKEELISGMSDKTLCFLTIGLFIGLILFIRFINPSGIGLFCF